MDFFFGPLAEALSAAGLAAEYRAPRAIVVCGCTFIAFSSRRSPRTIHFMQHKFRVARDGTFDQELAVKLILEDLPSRLRRNELDKLKAGWQRAVRGLCPDGETRSTCTFDGWKHSEGVHVGVSDDGFLVQFSTKDEETLEWVLELLRTLPL